MGDPRGFLRDGREGAPRRPVAERLRDWSEISAPREPAVRTAQAGRCMDCGVPFCHQGCPLGNPIPDFNDLVWRGRWRAAWAALSATNNFPEFTGRLCPAPCEASCVLAINDDPVTIEQIELEIAERAWEEGWERPQPARTRTWRTVAVVGSGPAGLAAAQQLARAGHAVTVYERDAEPGGLLRYGIPDFKLDKRFLDRRLDQLRAEGVVFETGADVGRDPTWEVLRDRHDAVLVAVGAGRARELKVPGRDAEGVHLAMDYLSAVNRAVAGEPLAPAFDAAGRHVIILGGGDTGSDCLGTALRQGAASVTQVELFPAPPPARAAANPWPDWPVVLRTSSSQEEGGQRVWALATRELAVVDGRVAALVADRVSVEGGALTPTGEQVRMPCDLLLLAMGFVSPVTDALQAQLGVPVDPRGNVAAVGHRTPVPGVYVAGDARRGASLIVWAIREGRDAAAQIHADLMR